MELSFFFVSPSTFYIVSITYEFFILICLIKVMRNYLAEIPHKREPLSDVKIKFWQSSIALIFCTLVFFFPGLSYEKKWDGSFAFFFDGLDRIIHFLFLTAIFLSQFYTEEALLFLTEKHADGDDYPNWRTLKCFMITPLLAFLINTTWPIWCFIEQTCFKNSFAWKVENFEHASYLSGFVILNSAFGEICFSLGQIAGLLGIFIYIFFLFRAIPTLKEIYVRFIGITTTSGLKLKKFRLKEWGFFIFGIFFIGAFKTLHALLIFSWFFSLGFSKWVGFDDHFFPTKEDIIFRIQNPENMYWFIDIHSVMNAIQFGLMSFILAFIAPSQRYTSTPKISTSL